MSSSVSAHSAVTTAKACARPLPLSADKIPTRAPDPRNGDKDHMVSGARHFLPPQLLLPRSRRIALASHRSLVPAGGRSVTRACPPCSREKQPAQQNPRHLGVVGAGLSCACGYTPGRARRLRGELGESPQGRSGSCPDLTRDEEVLAPVAEREWLTVVLLSGYVPVYPQRTGLCSADGFKALQYRPGSIGGLLTGTGLALARPD